MKNNLSFREFYKRRLPHIQVAGGTYFITFRLANSLPLDALNKLAEERQKINKLPDKQKESAHQVCTPLKKPSGTYFGLTEILHSLKRHTAREANKILQRSGTFWQDESYDHLIRDDTELERIVKYVSYNPVKANLVKEQIDWKWSYSKYEI